MSDILTNAEIEEERDAGNWSIWAPSVLGATILDLRERPLAILSAHIPSISDSDESEMLDRLSGVLLVGEERVGQSGDIADLALRTCSCGKSLDGFYEYVDHLKEVLK